MLVFNSIYIIANYNLFQNNCKENSSEIFGLQKTASYVEMLLGMKHAVLAVLAQENKQRKYTN